MRIPCPNFTQIPNDLFDEWLPKLEGSELKIILVIMRKTFGWHKVRDFISISSLVKITGLIEETVVRSVKSLLKKRLISKKVEGPVGKQKTYYEIIVVDEEKEENNSDSSNSKKSNKNEGDSLGLNGGRDNSNKDYPLGLNRGVLSGDTKETSLKRNIVNKKQQQQRQQSSTTSVTSKSKESAPAAVVVSSIEEVEEKKKILMNLHDFAENFVQKMLVHPIGILKQACEAVKKIKRVENYRAALTAAIKEGWKTQEKPTLDQVRKTSFFSEILTLDMKKIGDTQIIVGNSYVEFNTGSHCEHIEILHPDFKKIIIEKMKNLRKRKDGIVEKFQKPV